MIEEIGKCTIIVMSGPLVLAFVAAVYMLMAWTLLWAWNYAVPVTFGLPSLTYWKAYSLLIVAHMLIKNSQTIKAGK